MAELTTQVTFVRLARDRVRLFAAPAAFFLVAAGAVAAGLLAGGPVGISLVAVGGVAALAAAYLAALVSSYRLLVEPGALKLRWLGGEHRYRLIRGPVTRVAVRGREAAALHPRFGALGWAVGPAVLRGDEPIELIRLSVRPALIVVPTDRGRLAIAPADEGELLSSLTSSVRLRERLDEIASRRGLPAAPAIATTEPAQAAAPRVLTGIERTLIEQRLAAERAAAQAATQAVAQAAAQAVAQAASQAAAQEAAEAELAAAPAASVAAPAPSITLGPPPAAVAPAVPAAPRVARRRERARAPRPAWLGVPGPSSVVRALPIILPLIGAGIAWVAVTAAGRPALPNDEARLLLVALALVGPMGAVGGLIARVWYPRLGGLVMASAVAALAMLTRTILG